MLSTPLLAMPTPGRGGLTEVFDFFEAQDRVPIICEAIADRVRSGAAPSVAIAAELRERFPAGRKRYYINDTETGNTLNLSHGKTVDFRLS